MSEATHFQLPGIDPAARPEFADGASAKAWVEDLPLANVPSAQQQLLLQIEELSRCALDAEDRYAALEAVREAVNFVQIEQAKRFTNRALPMLESEAAVYEDTIELWEQMRTGYLRCLQDDAAALRGRRALICQRALAYSGLRMFHHYRAYHEVPARDWRGLHQVYAHAERLGVTEGAVKDYLNRDVHDSSPRIAYLRAVLMGLCGPNELSPRQLTFVAYLLERWADRVEVSSTPIAEGDLPPLTVDLAGERGAERGAPRGGTLRFLDVRRLAKSLRNRVALLRKGESPARLALGEDCVQPSCEQLLVFLYRQWCQARPPRGAERKRASDAVQACTDFAAVHFHVAGRSFRPPSGAGEVSAAELATFGRAREREDGAQDARNFLVEQWELEDESAIGLRMVCRTDSPGRRLAHGQLVGVRPADARTFQLAQVRWLTVDGRGALHCGLKLLPGVPQAVAVRGTGVNVAAEKYVPAFMLEAVPALKAGPSMVVPPGWFRPRRVVELAQDERTVKARLLAVLERGADFERLDYEPLPE